MSSNRIEWTCPECSKRFAIPADIETPERCPECMDAAAQKETSQKQQNSKHSQKSKPTEAERIEWTCPGCHQRFAIPDDIETPALCPECEKSRTIEPAPEIILPPSTSKPPVEQFLPPPENNPQAQISALPELPAAFASSRRVQKVLAKKYPALQLIAMFYKGAGVLLFIIAVVGTIVAMTQGALTSSEVDGVTQLAGSIRLVIMFLSGTFAAIGCYAFGELISLLIDIEFNTRRHSQD